MFVRIKTTPNSPRRSVQLVEAVRDGGKVRQRIVRHVGVAMDEDELERLRQLGEYVKAKLEDERQPLLFAPEKIADQVIRLGRQGDGLAGVITNLRDASVSEVMSHYHGLWQVEESFRITKHDLKVRPIWHWNSDRIRAHIAIAFMAFACVRHLAYRVAIQKRRMSPEVIRSALVHRQCSVLRCRQSGNRYVIPSKPTAAAEQIYATMGLPLTITPYQLA